jgi:hypothetical protein
LRCLAFAAFTILFSVTLISAQDHSKVDVFGGYSYLNADINDLGSRKSANGWEAAASGNFNKWLAAEFDVSGYYRTETLDLTPVGLGTVDIKLKDYSYVAGPRLNFKPIFVHALLGGDHLSASTQGFSRSQDSSQGHLAVECNGRSRGHGRFVRRVITCSRGTTYSVVHNLLLRITSAQAQELCIASAGY